MTKSIGELGYWAGLAAFASVIAYDVVQTLQIVGALHFPWDEILIYGTSLCIVVPFILAMLSLHYLTPHEKQFWTHAAIIFTAIYAVFVIANYVVQLVTVIPAKIAGASEAIRLLDQTPHSMFWNYDAIGYISMGFAAGLAVPAIGDAGFERWVRISFIAHALVTPLISIVYFYPRFSERLLLLGFPWAITAPLFMILLAIMLRRRANAMFPRDDAGVDSAAAKRGREPDSRLRRLQVTPSALGGSMQMSDDSEKLSDQPANIIHLGTFKVGGKGPGSYVGGVAKLRADPERDLLSAADSFLTAADRCLNSCKHEDGVEMLTVPGAVCASLSCELFLKYVVLKESGSHTKGHKLDELFLECSDEAQTALVDRRADIREVFERNSAQFVGARYHHESEQFSFRQQELLQAAELLSAFVREIFQGETA